MWVGPICCDYSEPNSSSPEYTQHKQLLLIKTSSSAYLGLEIITLHCAKNDNLHIFSIFKSLRSIRRKAL